MADFGGREGWQDGLANLSHEKGLKQVVGRDSRFRWQQQPACRMQGRM